eukprot:Gb_00378 [translate_table: standard]
MASPTTSIVSDSKRHSTSSKHKTYNSFHRLCFQRSTYKPPGVFYSIVATPSTIVIFPVNVTTMFISRFNHCNNSILQPHNKHGSYFFLGVPLGCLNLSLAALFLLSKKKGEKCVYLFMFTSKLQLKIGFEIGFSIAFWSLVRCLSVAPEALIVYKGLLALLLILLRETPLFNALNSQVAHCPILGSKVICCPVFMAFCLLPYLW